MDYMYYIHKGGILVYFLIGLNVIGFSIMIWKIFVLTLARKNRKKMVDDTIKYVNLNNRHFDKETMQIALDYQLKKIEFGLNTVKIIASIAPLIGLLGTVIGILQAFESISIKGLGDPAAFSGGVSVALITTVAGLMVAIPHYIGYNYITSLLDNIEMNLEKEVLEQI